MSNEGFERVAAVDDLDEGKPMSVELSNNEEVCIIKVSGQLFAISNNCTHAEFPMSDGEMVDDFVIECGLHGAQFDVRDGSVIELPAMDPIGCYEVKAVDRDIWVRANPS